MSDECPPLFENQAWHPWGNPISDERQADLKELADQQRAWAEQPEAERGDSHFKGVKLTGADVFWLAAYALAWPAGDVAESIEELRSGYGVKVPALHVDAAYLYDAHLQGAILTEAHLEEADLSLAHLEEASLHLAHLEKAELSFAHLAGAELSSAHLERAHLWSAYLEQANLGLAHLEGANLIEAHLEGADFYGAYLEGTYLEQAHLEGAVLNGAYLGKTSRLNAAHLNGAVLDQVIFDNVNLTVVDWREVRVLGDETRARKTKYNGPRAGAYHAAARAYRALSVALRAQGLGNEATRFHYRAEVMGRYEQLNDLFARLFSRRFYTAPAAFARWLLSWLLGTFAGYGDRLGRLFVTYLVTVTTFAALMFVFAGRPPSFDSIRDVFVLSITSFHGRGVQPPGLRLNDALATLTAIEAFFGLAIEGIFIAAFTRRVTGN